MLFTSESVTEGHPDKVADQIADAVLDAVLEQDPLGRVACEVMLLADRVIVGGEITTEADLNIGGLTRDVLWDIGYRVDTYDFDVEVNVNQQSPSIGRAVEDGGAGDQGIMYGYATDETRPLMPLPIMLAHSITRRLAEVRHDGTMTYLRPDGKAQVTVAYDDEGRPQYVESVVISAHTTRLGATFTNDIITNVVRHCIPHYHIEHIHVDGFENGGPRGDTGLTGRKIMVDTYGGWARHGGGAFSGKDPTKVDRSGAYACRWVARNVVAAKLARRCEVSVAYILGHADPVCVNVDTFGTNAVSLDSIDAFVRDFDMRPASIIRALDLRRPIYRATAVGGHFGRREFSWESSGQRVW